MAKRPVSNEKFLQANPLTAEGSPLGIFVRAFIAAALWTSDEEVGSKATLNQFERPSLESLIEQCQQFISVATERGYLLPLVDMSQAGHDFWLTRNGHGAGFWDRDEEVYGEGNGVNLSTLCGWDKMFGEVDLQKIGRKIETSPLYNEETQADKYKAWVGGNK